MRPSSAPLSSCQHTAAYSVEPVSSTSSYSVPFHEVSASMRGPLFPFQPDQDSIRNDNRQGKRLRLDLLDILVQDPGHCVDGDNGANIKGKCKDTRPIWSPSERTLCVACSAASKSTSSSATLVSRSASWLKFEFGGTIAKFTSSSLMDLRPSPSLSRICLSFYLILDAHVFSLSRFL
jgi:hypothetical protein